MSLILRPAMMRRRRPRRILDRLPLYAESFRADGDTDREVLAKHSLRGKQLVANSTSSPAGFTIWERKRELRR